MQKALPSYEQVECLFGHELPTEMLFQRADWLFDLPGEFAWRRCPVCGLLMLSPRPVQTAIGMYYPSDYAPYKTAIEDEPRKLMRWKRRRNLRNQIEAVNNNAKQGTLLDIGCATGIYLAEMRRFGWQVQGIEPQAEAADYARRRFDLPVFNGDLLQSHLPDSHFDAATMWDVLEHTHDPAATLSEVRRLLKPDGLLVMTLPDPDSKEAESFGPAWVGYDAPRHLYLFGGASLDLLLDRTGFKPIARDHFLASYHTWVVSWQMQRNRRRPTSSPNDPISKIARLPFWPLLTSPYFRWLNRRGRGSVVTVYARATK